MNVLWVFAHPEPRSLSGALRDDATRALEREEHAVTHSDLYAMGWNPVVTAADYGHDPQERFRVGPVSASALERGTLSADVLAEQDKLKAADALVVQFPLWWYSVPAILKGWFDRVFLKDFAYGIEDPAHPGRTLRYGDGNLAGRRALVVTTAGGRAPALGPRGINGDVSELLFPLLHGTLFYVGMEVLPPVVVPGANRVTDDEFRATSAMLRERVLSIPTAEPLAYRTQNDGGYDDDLVLDDRHAPGRAGLGVHLQQDPTDPS
ncbi:NAD(P)H dehydrogenase (quinone) [Pseudonocardia ammonioxydans]|uniref:NAD(P)H dehydrogenase (Quinone) n=1 Tax=Pseudonocardia ammonioxydans TaxID=260086 RepID=A0A1I4YDB5_PSUAM|nr:NAD(P)H-dependent oxidoreductase [Pseudonocardia ammonioxydans]SFN36024.1 NAD(P)H dehydrogenase (quinone) [Pseudonocardia ammonioxydans]